MTNVWSFWFSLYIFALDAAGENFPTQYSSRIDGAVLPYANTNEEQEVTVFIDYEQSEKSLVDLILHG